MQRRDFLKIALAAPLAAAPKLGWAAGSRKKVLFLGGRGYFGPVSINALLRAGHDVTITNRGITNPYMFPELRYVWCDRETKDGSGLERLVDLVKREHFDLVIDTWQKHPAAVLETAKLFSDRIPAYHYVSSIAVYDKWDEPGVNEDFPLDKVADNPYDWENEYPYGNRKTMCENAIRKYYPETNTIFRSHGMRGFPTVDPIYEPYWPVRIMRGGDVLVPKQEGHVAQYTDIVSLAEFMVTCSEEGISGAFNTAFQTFRFEDYLKAVQDITDSDVTFHWIDPEKLKGYGVQAYRDLPLWRPEPVGFYHVDVSKAVDAGMNNRSLQAALRDELGGYLSRHPRDDFVFGQPNSGTLSMEREAEILKDWLARKADKKNPGRTPGF